MLAGADAGTGVRGADSAVQSHSMGGARGERRETHKNTHTGTYTLMLHLPFSDLPHRVLQGAAQRGAQFYFMFAVLPILFHATK